VTDLRFARLEDVILDEAFPEVDLALRRGRHIDRDDAEGYALLVDAQDHLEVLYRRYGCELVHKSDGYFYLLPTSERLGKRHLSPGEMLVGQALALLYLDPGTASSGGVVTRDQVLSHLAGVVGDDVLVRALNPKRRRYDERVAADTVRARVADALRRLAALGFIDASADGRHRLRAPLLRFAEPLRGEGPPGAKLEAMIEAGELVLAGEDVARDDEAADDEGSAPDEAPLEGPPPESPS
jgi:chromosome partition protein MukE